VLEVFLWGKMLIAYIIGCILIIIAGVLFIRYDSHHFKYHKIETVIYLICIALLWPLLVMLLLVFIALVAGYLLVEYLKDFTEND
jgi:NhaP-type Na+/H+ or K+/H+ antiporter